MSILIGSSFFFRHKPVHCLRTPPPPPCFLSLALERQDLLSLLSATLNPTTPLKRYKFFLVMGDVVMFAQCSNRNAFMHNQLDGHPK